jgi:hypothetical protein
MKFNPTWNQVVLLLGLLAIVAASHVWAPASVQVIVSMAGVVLGFLAPTATKSKESDAGVDK